MNEIEMYGKCQLKNTFNDAIISWDNWNDYWSLTEIGAKFSTLVERKTLCFRENHRTYIGLSKKSNFENAFKICRSFGGRLPVPHE